VLDTAYADDTHSVEKRCQKYSGWIEDMNRIDAEVWLALHQPLWLRNPDGSQDDNKPDSGPCVNKVTKSALPVLRAQFEPSEPKRRARLVLSGDTHVFQFFQPTVASKPVQIVAGNGGTKLDNLYDLLPLGVRSPLSNAGRPTRDGDTNVKLNSYGVEGAALTVAQHGFVTLHRTEWIWTVQMLGVAGRSVASCRFSEAPDSAQLEQKLDCSADPQVKASQALDSGMQPRRPF
jgi:hypothetical protein